jgi:hypothetical protein
MASIFFQAHSLKKRGKEIGIFPGKPRRDFVFIDEIIHANLYAFEMYTKFNCKVFEVGTGVAHSFEEGLEHLGFTYFYLPQSQIQKISYLVGRLQLDFLKGSQGTINISIHQVFNK